MCANVDNQLEFSSVLFDTLFGLVLFFSIDSFIDIQDPIHFIFYLFSTIILVHWWLIFKSADDCFAQEVTKSAADLVFGIIYIIMIEYVILLSKTFEYFAATGYLLALFTIDLVWALTWLFVGHWQTKNTVRITQMEEELRRNIKSNLLIIVCYSLLLFGGSEIIPLYYVAAFILIYLLYIFFTFRTKIIDIKLF